jgi:hypothetical protein
VKFVVVNVMGTSTSPEPACFVTCTVEPAVGAVMVIVGSDPPELLPLLLPLLPPLLLPELLPELLPLLLLPPS